MSKMYSTANLSDKELKEQGNRLFTLHKYEDAANCYSKAIVSFNYLKNKKEITWFPTVHVLSLQIKNPNQALYFTNRALCHLKLKRWQSSCQDCRRALDIDRSFDCNSALRQYNRLLIRNFLSSCIFLQSSIDPEVMEGLPSDCQSSLQKPVEAQSSLTSIGCKVGHLQNRYNCKFTSLTSLLVMIRANGAMGQSVNRLFPFPCFVSASTSKNSNFPPFSLFC